jgi:Protein kinase domain
VAAAFLYALKSIQYMFSLNADAVQELSAEHLNLGLVKHAVDRTIVPARVSVRKFPRHILWDTSRTNASTHHYFIEMEPAAHNISYLDAYERRSEKVDLYQLETYLVNQLDDDYQEHCVYMKEWQSMSYPTCNSVHELALDHGDLTAFSEGGWRQVFDHSQTPGSVLKMLHLGPDEEFAFDLQAYEVHRVDAVISERLTSSPFVMDIYGYCGTSALYEQGKRSLRHEVDHSELPHKYRMMLQIAQAMSDMHGIDYPSGTNATVVHRDLKPSNIMMGLDGKAKLGDFNDSILRKWNKTSGEPCPFYNDRYPLHWGLGYKPAEHAASGYPPLDEKMDVFGLGGLLFFVLTKENPFGEFEKENMTAAINTGRLPRLPDEYNVTMTPHISIEIATVVQAIQRTMVLDPRARPTSKEVLEILKPHLGVYSK